jgi:hypothetical protein
MPSSMTANLLLRGLVLNQSQEEEDEVEEEKKQNVRTRSEKKKQKNLERARQQGGIDAADVFLDIAEEKIV